MLMHIRKGYGKEHRAVFTKNEQKAMYMEIQRQLAEYDKKHTDELESMILWVLHEEFGFGSKRLK